MTFEPVNPPALAAPRGFSHAVSTTRGRTVYLAGQTALDADGRIIGDDVVSQFEQALGNLLAALAAAGGSGRDLATVTVYVVDMDDYLAHAREIGVVWDAWSARTIRRWQASGSPACGTSRHWSRSRASPSWSEALLPQAWIVVRAYSRAGLAQQRIEVGEELRRLAPFQPGGSRLRGRPGSR